MNDYLLICIIQSEMKRIYQEIIMPSFIHDIFHDLVVTSQAPWCVKMAWVFKRLEPSLLSFWPDSSSLCNITPIWCSPLAITTSVNNILLILTNDKTTMIFPVGWFDCWVHLIDLAIINVHERAGIISFVFSFFDCN